MIKLMHGDCLKLMNDIPSKSIDMVLTDLPYGTTALKWDSVIPFESIWKHLNRIVKENGAVVLFGCEPFSSALRMSNIKNYKYDWYWNKTLKTGFLNAHKQPLRSVETVSVFYRKQCPYYPVGLKQYGKIKKRGCGSKTNSYCKTENFQESTGYPDQQLFYSRDKDYFHPTQKPIPLLEYLIKTYTQENETVLDFTAGSFSTAIACMNTNRQSVNIEKDEKYFDIGSKRVLELNNMFNNKFDIQVIRGAE